MRVYVGQSRGADMIRQLESHGFGECVSRGEIPPRRTPWFLDNGAFGDWKAGRVFDGNSFMEDLTQLRDLPTAPDFIVCPDIVAGGHESLTFSLTWAPHIAQHGPLYLAVQDGMVEVEVLPHLQWFAGIFVGGSLGWKLRTGASWVRFARAQRINVHVGRVGTRRRVAWAKRIGASSIDSSLPLWSAGNMGVFLRALREQAHPELPLEAA